MIRRGRNPSDPSTAAMFWSATKIGNLGSAVKIDSDDAGSGRDRAGAHCIEFKAGPRRPTWPRLVGRLHGRGASSAQGSASWESSFRSKRSRRSSDHEPLAELAAGDAHGEVNETDALYAQWIRHPDDPGSRWTTPLPSGGKRPRPILHAGDRRPGGDLGDDHVGALAAAVEFMHTATLPYDDVVDESDMRRGRQAARGCCGATRRACWSAISSWARRSRMARPKLARRLASTFSPAAAVVIAEGEVMQLSAAMMALKQPRTPISPSFAPRPQQRRSPRPAKSGLRLAGRA